MAAAGNAEIAAPVLHDEARQWSVHGRRSLFGGDDSPRWNRCRSGPALHRAAGPGCAREARTWTRSRRRLRHFHDYRGAAFLAAEMVALADWQLGLVDHRDDDHDQGGVLPAERRIGALDGQDENRRAENESAAGAVRERQAAAPDQDDGALQAGEDQSAWRVPADHGADPGVHRVVLGAAVGGRASTRAVDRLDSRSVGA